MKIGIVDTTFSRVNMGSIALDELDKIGGCTAVRTTVPGIKDLPVECKKLLDDGCDIVMALGMVGGAPIDTQCGHEASLGIQQAKLMTNKHIIEVFIHENEAWNEKEFIEICDNRIRKHVHNAIALVNDPKSLVVNAGKGIRQGKDNEGEASADDKQITIGLVIADFNPEITKEMEKSAIVRAKTQNAILGMTLHVPGAYDAPLAAKKLLIDKKHDAVVVLGAIIKGDTKHDDVIAQSAADALTNLSLEFNKPVTLGIIGPGATEEHAEKRKKEYAERAVDAAIILVNRLRR
jgi:riboflavin synthase